MTEQEIFLAAVEISDAQARRAYLDQACAGNPPLRQQVDALLNVHAGAGDFLAKPAIEQIPAKATAIDGQDAPQADQAESEQTQGFAHEFAASEEATLKFLAPATKPNSLGRLGHYEVHQVLGHGAFGIVLKAFDEKLHRIVAIKVLSPELAATSPPRKRFLREARAAAAVRHDHVVAVHAVEEQPIPYLVMEFIPGLTLDQALNEHGPLDASDVLRLGQQIACGLAAAHAQGLIHRDIKPSNILLENGLVGRVKITDFGLARAANDASVTQSGTIAGTPLYMSPEQAISGKIDQRSDLFSLGSVLYVMVSGRPPFRAATTLAVLKRVVEDTPRPIREIIADVPGWLCAIIAKLQAKQPDDRFATAREVADLLGQCLADLQANRPVRLPENVIVEEKIETIAAPVDRLSASETSRRQTTSRRVWPTIAALALIVLAGLGVTEATGVTKLTSTVIRLTTGSGTLVIETDDPGVKVTIDGEEVQIQGAGVEQLTLKPGQYQVAAVKDGEPVSQQLVTITRGGKQVVRVTMEGTANVNPPVSRDPKGSEPVATDADRRAAEWVLSVGGEIWALIDDKYIKVSRGERLPTKSFELKYVFFFGTKITDADLAQLRHCGRLSQLQLYDTPVTGEGLAHLKDCKNLVVLWMNLSAVTDAGLAHFPHPANLRELELAHTDIGDTGLSHFRDSKQLSSLNLIRTRVTDAGLVHFRHCHDLLALKLSGSNIGDEGLRNFKDCHQLETVYLLGTRVSDAGLLVLGNCEQLAILSLVQTSVSDVGLQFLERFKKLSRLAISDTKVTEAGVTKLAAALPKCRIEWDGGVIEPRESSDSWHGWPADAPQPAIAPFDAEQAKKHQEEWAKYLGVPVEYTNTIGMKFRLIPPGEFLMGSTAEEIEESLKFAESYPQDIEFIKSQVPKHKVILTKPVYFGICEVTQAQYESIMGKNPSGFSSGGQKKETVEQLDTSQHPVESVGWIHAVEYTMKLSAKEQLKSFYFHAGDRVTPMKGNGYRLPTEAEWEFACRAGTRSKYSTGDQDANLIPASWLDANSGGRTHKVGELAPNPFGLYDMHGNAWEWVQDGWEPTSYDEFADKPALDPSYPYFDVSSYHVLRGGGWDNKPCLLRSASRNGGKGGDGDHRCGFRVALPVDAIKQVLSNPPTAVDPDRRAAEWVLSKNGSIRLLVDGKQLNAIKAVAELPRRAYVVTGVLLSEANVTDAELKELQHLAKLVHVDLSLTAISDAGLPHLQELRELRYLTLLGTKISDAGLQHLSAIPNLISLSLIGTKISDEGLNHLHKIEKLSVVRLESTKVTETGVKKLAAALPRCRIEWDGGVIEPRESDDPDRRAAEYVLSVGGTVHVLEDGAEREITAAADLPDGTFRLTEMNVFNNPQVTDAGLSCLEDCRDVLKVTLRQTDVSDAGLAHFRNCRHITFLRLSAMPRITDAGLAQFSACRDLEFLELDGNVQHTDAALAHFRNCKNLRTIYLQGLNRVTDAGLAYFRDLIEIRSLVLRSTMVTDAGLASVANCKALSEIDLSSTPISDRGLEVLAGFPNLQSINIASTKVTEAGVKKLAAALPQCRIEWDGGVIEPREATPTAPAAPEPKLLTKAERDALQWVVNNGGRLWTTLGETIRVEDLPVDQAIGMSGSKARLQIVSLTLKGPKVTDEVLETFIELPPVGHLAVLHCPLSDAGFAKLMDAPVARHARDLVLQGPTVTRNWLDAVRKVPHLNFLQIRPALAVDADAIRSWQALPLHRLELTHGEFGPAEFEALGTLRSLEALQVSQSQIDDAGFQHLQVLSELTSLTVDGRPGGPSISDAGLAGVERLQKLTYLNLTSQSVTDEGIQRLHKCRELREVRLNGTKVTEQGVQQLAAALPRCKIEWRGGVIEPRESSAGWHGWPKDAPPPASAPFDAEQAKNHQESWAAYLKVPVEYTNSLGMKFRLIPPGEFLMGSTAEEIEEALEHAQNYPEWKDYARSEGPQHRVILTQPVYLGIHEVTQKQYESVIGTNPAQFTATGAEKDAVTGKDTSNFPVETVSWVDAAEFCAKLSEREKLNPVYFSNGARVTPLNGDGYRLPTEAQWEFACRAGTTTKFWSGDRDDDLMRAGWFGPNSGARVHAVGELLANPFGLYDVHGNVWEWVEDAWALTSYSQYREQSAIDPYTAFTKDSQPVIRGGPYDAESASCRASLRGALGKAGVRAKLTGFRVALPVDAVKQALPQTPLAADPDRRAAEWVLSIGGTIKIREHGEEREIKTATDLPDDAFELTVVDLHRNPNVTDTGLANFEGCKHVEHLDLYLTGLSDAGLASFQNCKRLTHVNLANNPVTDAGLALFKDLHDLTTLALGLTRVTDAGLAHFNDCKNLTDLELTGTQGVTDVGLAHFRNCKALRYLGLESVRGFSDAGLTHFQGCTDLRLLDLTNTRTSDAGLANFQDCKHLTRLDLDGTQVTDAGLANFQDCKNLEMIYLNSTQVTDQGLVNLKNCQKLTHLFLNSTQVTDVCLVNLKHWPKLYDLGASHDAISDAALVDLVKHPSIGNLGLANTRISLFGFEELKRARPEFKIDWSETNRTIAESVLTLGGKVEIGTPGEPESRPVADVAELPAEYFQVRRVSLAGVEKPLEKLPELLSQLKYPQFDHLERLDLSGIAGLTYEFLPPIYGLRELNLADAGLTDIKLAQLPKLFTLKHLVLDGNDIRGPGLASLKEQPALIDLSLKHTRVTAVKIDELKQALPQCRIEWDGGVIEPREE